MKVFLKQRYSNEAFESVLVKATTRFERNALKLLKEDLFDDNGFFDTSLLGESLCVKYAKTLGYDIPDDYDFDPDHGGLSWWENDPEFPGWRYFNCIPAGTEVIEAALKMSGRYRKLARFRKEVARIERIRMERHERAYNDLSKKIDESWEQEQEAV